MRDLEVLQYYFNLMEEVCNNLEIAVNKNDIDGANNLKRTIVDISQKIAEELR